MKDKKMNNVIGYIINETATTSTTEGKIIGESKDRVITEAIIQDMDKKNRNSRIYPSEELIPQLKSKRLLELDRTNNLFGEAGHPMSPDIARQQVISPTNISHRFLKIWVEGSYIKAHVKGTPTKLGEEFNNHILEGTLPSYSLRAFGTIIPTKRGNEVRNPSIITWDWVIYPSHECAYTTKILSESAKAKGFTNVKINFSKESNLYLSESDSGLIVPIQNKKVVDFIKEESANVKSILNTFDSLYETAILCENGRQVKLMDRSGDTIYVNLENYVQDTIMDYCIKMI